MFYSLSIFGYYWKGSFLILNLSALISFIIHKPHHRIKNGGLLILIILVLGYDLLAMIFWILVANVLRWNRYGTANIRNMVLKSSWGMIIACVLRKIPLIVSERMKIVELILKFVLHHKLMLFIWYVLNWMIGFFTKIIGFYEELLLFTLRENIPAMIKLV